MSLLTYHSQDFSALEQNLFSQIEALKKEEPLAPIAVVVPTQTLLRYLRRRFLENGRSYLQFEFLSYPGLARAVLEGACLESPAVIGKEVLGPLLAGVLDGMPDGSLHNYLRRFPGAFSAFLGICRELRDAGLTNAELAPILRSSEEEELLRIFGAFEKALEKLFETTGRTDRAGLSRYARRFVGESEYVRNLRAVFHYGAYDLIQTHIDFFWELSGHTELRLMVPGVGDSPVFTPGRQFVSQAWVQQGRLHCLPAALRPALLGERLAGLYSEARRFESSISSDKVQILSAVGARGELEAAARRVLCLNESGVPVHEIGIVARSLEPYAPYLEPVLGGLGIPFHSTASQPLMRLPLPQAFVRLIEVLDEDFPREAFLELLRNTHFRTESLLRGARHAADQWDRFSREAGILGGAGSWQHDLPEWARMNLDQTERLALSEGDAVEEWVLRRVESAKQCLAQCEDLGQLVRGLQIWQGRWQQERTWPEW
ncbi:MAG: hypothetical protein JW937_02505, partial [Candidatus Omnitrophica bacterium]|nr:hypothetical protein [Candidatus Omnitrophota bacterium]